MEETPSVFGEENISNVIVKYKKPTPYLQENEPY
jgi:hypothetical protein